MNKEDNITISVDKIIKEINFPKTSDKKRITFFFGAGINKNIADDTEDWNKLAEQSIGNLAKNISKNKHKKCEIDEIHKEINNLLAISLSENPLKIKGNLKNFSECEWFIKGFEEIENSFLNNYLKNVVVITTNYDNFLSKVLKRNQIDLFRDFKDLNMENIFENTIYHLHGTTNDNGEIREESMITLHDYIKNSKYVEEYFREILTRKQNILDIVIIIGYSMQDLHIIRALNNFIKQKEKMKTNIEKEMKKVFLVDRLKCGTIEKRIEKIYQEIGITFLNIKNANSYEEDFKDFWTLLSDKIKKRDFDLSYFWKTLNVKKEKNEEIYDKRIDLLSLTKKIEKEWKTREKENWKNIKSALVKSITVANRDTALLFSRVMFTLLEKKYLSKEKVFLFLRNIKFKLPLEILIEFVNELKDELKNSKEKRKDSDQILLSINEDLNYYLQSYHFPWMLRNKIINSFKFSKSKFIQKIKKMKLNNIIHFLFKEIFFSGDFNKKEKEIKKIEEVFLENFTYLEINKIISEKKGKNYMLDWDFLADYEKASLFLSKLMERDLKKSEEPVKNALILWENGNIEKIFLFFENIFKKYNYWKIELLGLFKIPKLTLLMKNEAPKIIKKIFKDYEENKDNKNWKTRKYLYNTILTFLYYAWINNNKSEKSFDELRMLLKSNGYPIPIFSSFPSTLNIYGRSGGLIKPFSKYDQRLINIKKKKIISSFDDIKNALEKSEDLSDEIQLEIFKYLSKNLTPNIYIKLSKLKNLEKIEWGRTIDWKCSSFKKYITFLKERKKIKSQKNQVPFHSLLSWIRFEPPENIIDKVGNLIKEIKDSEYRIITGNGKNNINKELVENTEIAKLYNELAELAKCEYFFKEKSENDVDISSCEDLFLLTKRVILLEKVNKEKIKNKIRTIINQIFKSLFDWKGNKIFKIIQGVEEVEKWSELVFLFHYLYYFRELPKFKYNCNQIKELYAKTKMQWFNFYGIIRYCITKENEYVDQFSALQELAKWFGQILRRKKEFNKTNAKSLKWAFELDTLRLYLEMDDKVEAKFDLLVSMDNLFNVSSRIVKNNKYKLQDKRFLDVLSKIKIYDYNFANSILRWYEEINKLSKKIKSKLSEIFTKCIKSFDVDFGETKSFFYKLNTFLKKMKFLTKSDMEKIETHLKKWKHN